MIYRILRIYKYIRFYVLFTDKDFNNYDNTDTYSLSIIYLLRNKSVTILRINSLFSTDSEIASPVLLSAVPKVLPRTPPIVVPRYVNPDLIG